MSQVVKNLPAAQETRVQSLGWEDPLEKGMATHSSILAWRIPWTEEPGGLPSMVGYSHRNRTSFSNYTTTKIIKTWMCVWVSRSVMSDSLQSHGL